MVVGQRLEADAGGRAVDPEPGLADDDEPRRIDVEQRLGSRDLGRAVRRPGVRVEPGQIGEAPVLVRLGRQRQRPVALEQLSPHAGGAYRRCSIRSCRRDR